jgi:hypothetical protein
MRDSNQQTVCKKKISNNRPRCKRESLIQTPDPTLKSQFTHDRLRKGPSMIAELENLHTRAKGVHTCSTDLIGYENKPWKSGSPEKKNIVRGLSSHVTGEWTTDQSVVRRGMWYSVPTRLKCVKQSTCRKKSLMLVFGVNGTV